MRRGEERKIEEEMENGRVEDTGAVAHTRLRASFPEKGRWGGGTSSHSVKNAFGEGEGGSVGGFAGARHAGAAGAQGRGVASEKEGGSGLWPWGCGSVLFLLFSVSAFCLFCLILILSVCLPCGVISADEAAMVRYGTARYGTARCVSK